MWPKAIHSRAPDMHNCNAIATYSVPLQLNIREWRAQGQGQTESSHSFLSCLSEDSTCHIGSRSAFLSNLFSSCYLLPSKFNSEGPRGHLGAREGTPLPVILLRILTDANIVPAFEAVLPEKLPPLSPPHTRRRRRHYERKREAHGEGGGGFD